MTRIAKLKEGWDGPGSVPIPVRLIDLADRIVQAACAPIAPFVVPGGDGSLQIEWHTQAGEIEFDIDPNGRFSIWGQDHSTGTEFEGEDARALGLLLETVATIGRP